MTVRFTAVRASLQQPGKIVRRSTEAVTALIHPDARADRNHNVRTNAHGLSFVEIDYEVNDVLRIIEHLYGPDGGPLNHSRRSHRFKPRPPQEQHEAGENCHRDERRPHQAPSFAA